MSGAAIWSRKIKDSKPTENVKNERLEGAERGPVNIWGTKFHGEETATAKTLRLDPGLLEE